MYKEVKQDSFSSQHDIWYFYCYAKIFSVGELFRMNSKDLIFSAQNLIQTSAIQGLRPLVRIQSVLVLIFS